MSSSRLVRGAKTRMFACVCLICLLGALVFVFHGTQARLADVQKMANTCNQQQESLSAQLQVIFEYKLRLENSLKKEKTDHQATKESCETRRKEDAENREKETQEATNKYEALVQQCKLQKSQYEDEKESLEKSLSQHKDEKKRLETALEAAKEESQKIQNSLEDLKSKFFPYQEEIRKLKKENEEFRSKTLPTNDRINHLEKVKFQLEEELKKTKQSLVQCNNKVEKQEKEEKKQIQKPAPDNSALEPPRAGFLFNNVSTPGVNPEAVETDTSSVKPPVLKSPQLSKAEENVLQLPNKSTQESALPLAMPGHDTQGNPESQQQIPGPPDPQMAQRLSHHDSQIAREDHAAELHDNNLGPLNPVMGGQDDIGGNMIYRGQSWDQQQNNNLPPPHLLDNNIQQQQKQPNNQQQDHNNAVEEDEEAEPRNFIRQENLELPRPGKNQDQHYHGGDYDKEQPEEEEDDEGEQIDYVQGNDQVRKEDQQVRHHDHLQRHMDSQDRGIMVNPK